MLKVIGVGNAISILLLPGVTNAQATTFSIESVGSQVGLGSADLRTTTINVIQWVLGILVIITLAMFLVGFAANYLWSGASEPVHVWARRAMIASLIGLIIVLLAWAIVLFVIRTTTNVTTT